VNDLVVFHVPPNWWIMMNSEWVNKADSLTYINYIRNQNIIPERFVSKGIPSRTLAEFKRLRKAEEIIIYRAESRKTKSSRYLQLDLLYSICWETLIQVCIKWGSTRTSKGRPWIPGDHTRLRDIHAPTNQNGECLLNTWSGYCFLVMETVS
jgi:hypothetical protein